LANNTKQYHPYHLVDPSPWPFFAGVSVLVLTNGAVMYMHSYKYGFLIFLFGLFMVLVTMFFWWRDVIREATFLGCHTKLVQKGLRTGVILFIISEVLFFFGFFWAFFHSSLAPSIELGGMWPPRGIEALNPWEVPLLNTVILLSSGATITWAHHAIVSGDRKNAITALIYTILLAVCFTGFQALEYYEAPFTISDGIYGSTFFMTTGFHGFHVIIGTIFIFVCLIRLILHHFTRHHHVGFEAAAWYWHFVDVVWLFLFISVYWWGS